MRKNINQILNQQHCGVDLNTTKFCLLCHCEKIFDFRGNPDNKLIFTKYKLTQHFFDRKETLNKETLSLISARYLFVISRLLKFQNSDKVLKH